MLAAQQNDKTVTLRILEGVRINVKTVCSPTVHVELVGMQHSRLLRVLASCVRNAQRLEEKHVSNFVTCNFFGSFFSPSCQTPRSLGLSPVRESPSRERIATPMKPCEDRQPSLKTGAQTELQCKHSLTRAPRGGTKYRRQTGALTFTMDNIRFGRLCRAQS